MILSYRGSSVCIEAALNAVIPIYLNDGIENIDPIFQTNKLQTNDYKNFNDIIKKFQNKKTITNLRYLSNLQLYCKDYYSKFPKKLNNFLNTNIMCSKRVCMYNIFIIFDEL